MVALVAAGVARARVRTRRRGTRHEFAPGPPPFVRAAAPFSLPPPCLPRRMSEIHGLLLASLNPSTRKEAETNLQSLSLQQGFLSVLLRLVLEQSQDRPVRLAGSVYLKNVIKNRWDDVRGSNQACGSKLTR